MDNSSYIKTGLAFLVFSIFLGVISRDLYGSEKRLERWPVTEGMVLHSELTKILNATVRAGANSINHLEWTIVVEYEYMVSGVRYVGNRFSNSTPLEPVDVHKEPSQKLRDLLAKYPAGKLAQIHYNENAPAKSYLEIDTTSSRWFWLATAIFAAVGIAFLLVPLSRAVMS